MIHSDNGSCMVIPREDDIVRLYTQLSDEDVIDKETGPRLPTLLLAIGIVLAGTAGWHVLRDPD